MSKRKLSEVMEEMMRDALLSDKGISLVLGHGLRIGLSVTFGTVLLQLSRRKTYPSESEWDTVLKSFSKLPRDFWGRKPLPIQVQVTHKGQHHVIRGSWELEDMLEGAEWVAKD